MFVLKSWKTTLLGVLVLLTVVAKVIKTGGTFGTDEMAQVSIGIGLLLGKDGNVTGT